MKTFLIPYTTLKYAKYANIYIGIPLPPHYRGLAESGVAAIPADSELHRKGSAFHRQSRSFPRCKIGSIIPSARTMQPITLTPTLTKWRVPTGFP